jgi:hypothetical protein
MLPDKKGKKWVPWENPSYHENVWNTAAWHARWIATNKRLVTGEDMWPETETERAGREHWDHYVWWLKHNYDIDIGELAISIQKHAAKRLARLKKIYFAKRLAWLKKFYFAKRLRTARMRIWRARMKIWRAKNM